MRNNGCPFGGTSKCNGESEHWQKRNKQNTVRGAYKITNTDKYNHYVIWIKKNNIGDVEMLHIDDVIKIYDKVYLGCPRKVFLARWYPANTASEHANAEHRISAIKMIVESLGLELVDIGTRETGTFDIRSVMYNELGQCDIFIADLTGTRHNVMVEVGYALKHVNMGRMIFSIFSLRIEMIRYHLILMDSCIKRLMTLPRLRKRLSQGL